MQSSYITGSTGLFFNNMFQMSIKFLKIFIVNILLYLMKISMKILLQFYFLKLKQGIDKFG